MGFTVAPQDVHEVVAHELRGPVLDTGSLAVTISGVVPSR